MKQIPIFRSVILGSICLAILGEFLDFFVPGTLPPALEDAYAAYSVQDVEQSLALVLGVLALLMAMAGIALTLGLLLLKPWSRSLALGVTILSCALYPLFGLTLYSGWAFLLVQASTLLWGMALAMAYFSDLKVHFEK